MTFCPPYCPPYSGGVGPSSGGFISFIQTVMKPPEPFDPTTDSAVDYAYNDALQWVNCQLQMAPGLPGAWNMYAIAVYNLAGDTLINIAQDPDGAPTIAAEPTPLPFWAWTRQRMNIDSFIPGVVNSSSDVSTSVGYLTPDQFNGYTVSDLQNLKTPYGRRYLAIASTIGSLWGIS